MKDDDNSYAEELERAELVRAANKTGCDDAGCDHAGFLWRLRQAGDGWRCWRCDDPPNVENPVRDLELINAVRAPLAILRQKLGQ